MIETREQKGDFKEAKCEFAALTMNREVVAIERDARSINRPVSLSGTRNAMPPRDREETGV